MYKCLTCKNECEFEEINIIKTYISQKTGVELDKFICREDVVCIECNNNMSEGHVVEMVEINLNKSKKY